MGPVSDFLTPRQVAELTQLSYHSVLRAIKDGELRATRLRGKLRVRRLDLDAWADGQTVQPRETKLQLVQSPTAPRKPPATGSVDDLTQIEREAS